jgi:hypothetical protein
MSGFSYKHRGVPHGCLLGIVGGTKISTEKDGCVSVSSVVCVFEKVQEPKEEIAVMREEIQCLQCVGLEPRAVGWQSQFTA